MQILISASFSSWNFTKLRGFCLICHELSGPRSPSLEFQSCRLKKGRRNFFDRVFCFGQHVVLILISFSDSGARLLLEYCKFWGRFFLKTISVCRIFCVFCSIDDGTKFTQTYFFFFFFGHSGERIFVGHDGFMNIKLWTNDWKSSEFRDTEYAFLHD